MKRSLYEPLIAENLTTLKLRYDYRTDREYVYAAKEWESDIDWSQYNKSFYMESFLTTDDIRLNNKETWALFEKYGLDSYLKEVFGLLRGGKFFGMDCFYNAEKDMRFIANLHSFVLGKNNMDHAIYTGGIRRHEKDEEEIEVIMDGLNLGRAQSHKNVASGIPYGGGKITVQADPVDLNDQRELGFLSYALDRVRFFTGPDMRYPVELADAMAPFTRYIAAGLKNNPIGPSGIPTAWGTMAAMKEAVKFHFGRNNLKGLRVAVMGLGAVGFPQAEYLIAEEAKVIVCDPDVNAVQNLKEKYPDVHIEIAAPDEILKVDADILCPCAVGGFLTEEVIDELSVKMVFGAANNQLHANTKEDEIALAERMQKRGILYQECWVQNIGGVMSGMEMYRKGADADKEALMDRVYEVCGRKTRENLNEAKKLGITPTENAYRNVESRIYI